MNDLQSTVRRHFYQFYTDVYKSLSEYEPADQLTNDDLERLIGIINSIQLRYGEEEYETLIAGIIVHTAMDHLLINGNKRLSLMIGYFCNDIYGHRLILMQGNFARLIRRIVIEICNETDGSLKEKKRISAIKALACEIKEYSIPINGCNVDCEPVISYFKSNKEI